MVPDETAVRDTGVGYMACPFGNSLLQVQLTVELYEYGWTTIAVVSSSLSSYMPFAWSAEFFARALCYTAIQVVPGIYFQLNQHKAVADYKNTVGCSELQAFWRGHDPTCRSEK